VDFSPNSSKSIAPYSGSRLWLFIVCCLHLSGLLYPNINLFYKSVERGAGENFKFNTESEFIPILGLVEAKLNAPKETPVNTQQSATSVQDNHHPALLSMLAEELSVAPQEIHDFELYVTSSEKPVVF
jgi:aspartyl aminopeptidase